MGGSRGTFIEKHFNVKPLTSHCYTSFMTSKESSNTVVKLRDGLVFWREVHFSFIVM